MDGWQLIRDRWHMTCGGKCGTLFLILAKKLKKFKLLESKIGVVIGIYKKVFSCGQVTVDTWEVTGDTWHAVAKMWHIILNVCNKTKKLNVLESKIIAWIRMNKKVSNCGQVTGDMWHVIGDTLHVTAKYGTLLLILVLKLDSVFFEPYSRNFELCFKKILTWLPESFSSGDQININHQDRQKLNKNTHEIW